MRKACQPIFRSIDFVNRDDRNYQFIPLVHVMHRLVRSICLSVDHKLINHFDPILGASLHTEHTRSSTRTRSTMKKTSFQASEKMFDEVEYEEEIEEEDVRVIYQLHYNNWSSHTCPFPNPILQFRRRVRIYMDEVIKDEGDRVGPTIVHCRLVPIGFSGFFK